MSQSSFVDKPGLMSCNPLDSRLSKAKLAKHQKLLELQAIETEIRVVTKLLRHGGRPSRSKLNNYEQKIRTDSRQIKSRHDQLRALMHTRCSSRDITSAPKATPVSAVFPSSPAVGEQSRIDAATSLGYASAIVPSTPISVETETHVNNSEPAQSSDEVLPQYSMEPTFDRLMRFVSGYAMRPQKKLDLIPCVEEEQRAAHLTPLVPGRAVEGDQKDPKIRFKHKLFQKRMHVDNRRFIDHTKVYEVQDKLIASLFEEAESTTSSEED